MTDSTNLDLTEFVTKLIHDTFNAVTISSKEQAETYFELTKLAALDFDSFKNKHIQAADIDDELARLFPVSAPASADSPDQLHDIIAGRPYQWNAEQHSENPPLMDELDYKVSDDQKGSDYLLEETVTEIRMLVQDKLARQHYQSFKEIVRRGIPRVIIDSGRILAKISLKSIEQETETPNNTEPTEATEAARERRSNLNATVLNRGPRLNLSDTAFVKGNHLLSRNILDKLVKTRVGVTLPDPAATSTQTNSSLWGEIEIKFRTVD